MYVSICNISFLFQKLTISQYFSDALIDSGNTIPQFRWIQEPIVHFEINKDNTTYVSLIN